MAGLNERRKSRTYVYAQTGEECNEEKPCSNCVRHGVACSLAGGPYVPREDAKNRRTSTTSSSASLTQTTSQDTGLSSATASATGSRGPSPRPGPFQVLTGLIERPPPGENWTLDLELMHHFMLHTGFVLTEHHDMEYILDIWRVELPKVAFQFEYVMHSLLGFSALHKAYVEPENAQRLRESAVDHLDKALVLYRSEPSPATAENANAKFVFTWIVALFAYAIPPSLPPIDAIVELFMLVKGIDAILSETWFWVSQGPFAPILNRGFQEAVPTALESFAVPEGIDFGLNHLDYMIGVDAMLPDDRRTCALILTELKGIYNTMHPAQNSCSVASILCFPKQDSGSFAQLVKQRLPQALIILAYYCVMLDILDPRWWIHGWSKRVLQDVLGSLDEQWRHWIEWPVQTVLLKESTPRASANFMI
ncbi:uncharacterized protein LTR77_004504 [Saxophila tyrrhenica]|uniref:Zn(2)-C6 fungal-type domain-containing protein n=1 Tax=Saxophila tyrrhenica TaxID=1690608 RepID=A0AAV9PDM9_9PEZI|nr:hypothetical protein LTR77_004504 [Saxophila tyrrhenica]